MPTGRGAELPDWEAVSAILERSETGRRESALSTGVVRLDELLGGGIPRGGLSEITGPFSSGKTGLLFSILAQATARREAVAYIDAFDSFDPELAGRAGIDLDRLLWVRCGDGDPQPGIVQALKAADILSRTDGFGVLALDLESPRGSCRADLARVPLNSWFRLKRTLRGKRAALLLVGEQACSGSASSVVLGLRRENARWDSPTAAGAPSHARLLGGIASHARLLRGKKHGHVTLYCDF